MRYLRSIAILTVLVMGCSQNEPQGEATPASETEPTVVAKPQAEPTEVPPASEQPKPEPAPEPVAAAPAPEPVVVKQEPKPEPVAVAKPQAEQPKPETQPAATTAPAEAGPVDMKKLLGEMTDLRRLTKLPKPAYTTKQASSYDRKSKSPTEEWFANGDAGQFIRTEEKDGRKENVMMDADGPGAIVRIWSANPAGTLRIYLDGQDKPAIETKMETFLGGKFEGVPGPIAGERAKGWNSYLPIPYAKHCKVTSDEGGFYYHVNYRTYEAGTEVVTFKPTDLKELADKIADVAKRLDSPREGGGPPADRKKEPFDVSMAIEGEVILGYAKGPKAICGILVHLAANNIETAARQTMFYITFDGANTVKCPIGDFYCTFPGLNTYAGLPMGISENNNELDLWCHWWMPFEREVMVTARNFSPQRVDIKGAMALVPYDWDDRSMYFHTTWKLDKDVPARPMTDWNHLEAEGQGRFVGGSLFITNNVRDWWGEGDEKIYVDGETFPSHFGTGTEDYYGYAWCNPLRFIHAYHNQPNCQGPGNYGHTSVNRFHVIDDIPFTKSFKFDIENWHGSNKPEAKTTRAATSFWYARPGAIDHNRPLKDSDLHVPVVPPYEVGRVKGAIEGEDLTVIEKTGVAEPQELGTDQSNEKHLWWREGKPGDKLTLGFEAATEGKQHVIVRMTKAVDYAVVQLSVNGQKAGEPLDLYHDGVVPADEVDLGEFDLKKGQNVLTIEITGANPAAAKFYMVGLDYILLKGPASAPATQVN